MKFPPYTYAMEWLITTYKTSAFKTDLLVTLALEISSGRIVVVATSHYNKIVSIRNNPGVLAPLTSPFNSSVSLNSL